MLSNTLILIAGADLRDRETILHALGDQCHVIAAQTADDALAHVTDFVDLVISEIKSNSWDGLDFIRRWKLREPDTPFIVLSNGVDVSAVVEAMKSGAAECLIKPVDADELRSAALQLVEARGTAIRPDSDHPSRNGPHHKSNIDIPPDTSLEDLERAAVEQALIQHHGNRTHAARTLGISVRTLQRKLKSWGMPILSAPNPSVNNSFVMGADTTTHAFGMQTH